MTTILLIALILSTCSIFYNLYKLLIAYRPQESLNTEQLYSRWKKQTHVGVLFLGSVLLSGFLLIMNILNTAESKTELFIVEEIHRYSDVYNIKTNGGIFQIRTIEEMNTWKEGTQGTWTIRKNIFGNIVSTKREPLTKYAEDYFYHES